MESPKLLSITFTKSKKTLPIGSFLIRWWTKKPYSHVALKTQTKNWGYRYYQASDGKVNYEYETFFNQKHELVCEYNLEIPHEIDLMIREACYKEAGNGYAFWQNVGIFLTDVWYRVFHSNTKNPWTRGRNCSEILYINAFKVLLSDINYDENKIKPHQIEEILESRFILGEDGIRRLI